jgi:thymidylate synthase (FAD)
MNIGQRIAVGEVGFVELLDVLGSDSTIAHTARVSVREAKTRSEDRALLRTLVRERHSSPIEFGVMVFHLKMPIFVARQWVRHRMSSMSEVSGRYSSIPEEMLEWNETEWRSQGATNRQMSGDAVKKEVGEHCAQLQHGIQAGSYAVYTTLLEGGVAREQARAVLPLSTFTEFHWKSDCHNLMHFLKLRLAPDAQPEIQAYARILYQAFQKHFPLLAEAFEEYQVGAMSLSKTGKQALQEVVTEEQWQKIQALCLQRGMSQREVATMLATFQK